VKKAGRTKRVSPLTQLRREVDVKFDELSRRLASTIASFDRLHKDVVANFAKSDRDSEDILDRLRGICIPEIDELKAFRDLSERVRRLENGDLPEPLRTALDLSHPRAAKPGYLRVKGGWINIYHINSNGTFDIDTATGPYVDRSQANLNAYSGRIACIEIKDFDKGDGL
jgi:hypothetical protein